MLVSDQERLKLDIQNWIEKYGANRSALVATLQEIQRKYYYISEYAMQVVADILDIHPVEVYSVVSFYSFLDNKPKGKFIVRLCRTISCEMQCKSRVARQLENELDIKFGETTPDKRFTLEWTNCLGMCDQGPAMLINDNVHTKVTPEKVHEIIEQCKYTFGPHALQKSKEDLMSNTSETTITNELTFSKIDAIESLTKALAKERAEIISDLGASGIKGRGGAGFPTSVKWNLVAAAKADKKFVVCNADEGEPGTFKDRVILTNFPNLVFNGMTACGYTVGSKKGILYLRGEYTYLYKYLQDVLEKRRQDGLLGKNILGKIGFEFDIEIRMGSGAYVCGEETALIESLEGQRGEPRNRPPYPADTGYMGYPTVVNNVETFAWTSCIFSNGAEWFKAFGTDKSTGLKIFSISGDCEKPGVYELPMGIKVSELLKFVGGEGAKAVQIGGASGLCLPASEFERKVAYEDIPTGGSVIILGKDRDMLAFAENLMDFFVDESCGQCTPCREGNEKILEGIKMLIEGKCSIRYLNELIGLGETMQFASKCGLGQSSPNAFLSIVKHFKSEIMGRLNNHPINV